MSRTGRAKRGDRTLPFSDLAMRLASVGFHVFGACRPREGEVAGRGGRECGTLVLVGNAGPAIWDAFERDRDDAPDPLDRWTKRLIDPIAVDAGARAIYPFDRPHPPFQRWAERAGAAHRSPLGLLIHPHFGLWHAYRAALLFARRFDVPSPVSRSSPCDQCSEKPCLTACPVGAFSIRGYNVPGCAEYLSGPRGEDCIGGGCAARNACPVGRDYRFPAPQVRFHMTAFARAVGARSGTEARSRRGDRTAA